MLDFPSFLLPQAPPRKNPLRTSPIPHTCHMPSFSPHFNTCNIIFYFSHSRVFIWVYSIFKLSLPFKWPSIAWWISVNNCDWIIIIIIIIIIITFMNGIYSIYLKNYVSRVYSIAADLYLQSVLHVMLVRRWNMCCTFTLTLSAVCVQCPIRQFFEGYFLNFVLSR